MGKHIKLSKLFMVSALTSGLLLAGCGDDGEDGKDGKDGKDGVVGSADDEVMATTSGFAGGLAF